MITFELPGPPVGKARARVTRWGAYTPKKTQQHEAAIREAARQAMGEAKPIEGPLKAALVFCMPIPASWPKKRRQEALEGLAWPTGKPDADNLAKAVLDACNNVVYRDDSQIVALIVGKRYSAEPKTVAEFSAV